MYEFDGESWSPFYKNLVFSKQGKEWVLSLESGHEDNDSVDVTPVANASREDRLAAVKALPRLVIALTENVGKEIERVDAHAAEALAFTKTLEGLGAPINKGANSEVKK